jgi:hypothetical protein
VRIVGNYITNTGDDAIGLVSVRNDTPPDIDYDANEDILVEGNQIYDVTPATDVGCGVNIAGGHDIRVVNNSIDTVNWNGVVCWGGPTYYYTYKILISGNYIRNVGLASAGTATESAIRVTNTRDFQVLDNDLDLVPSNGVDLAGVVRDFVVHFGPMRRIIGSGLLLYPTADDTAALLSELWIDLGETAPVMASSGDGVVTGAIAGTTSDGIYAEGQASYPLTGLTIDVDVRDAGDNALELVYLEGCTIRARTRRSVDTGVRLGNSTQCDISAVSIDDLSASVVLVNSTHTSVHDCMARSTVAVACIWEDANCDHNIFLNNVAHGSGFGYNGTNTVTTSANVTY